MQKTLFLCCLEEVLPGKDRGVLISCVVTAVVADPQAIVVKHRLIVSPFEEAGGGIYMGYAECDTMRQ